MSRLRPSGYGEAGSKAEGRRDGAKALKEDAGRGID